MSRNRGATDCGECPGGPDHIVLEEPPRAVTKDIDPVYFKNHVGLVVAPGRCVLCHALYWMWVDWPSGPGGNYWKNDGTQRFVDSSYRHSFNDEPAAEDLPVYEVKAIVSYVRQPLDSHRYLEHSRPQSVATYRARQDAAVASRMSVLDEVSAHVAEEARRLAKVLP